MAKLVDVEIPPDLDKPVTLSISTTGSSEDEELEITVKSDVELEMPDIKITNGDKLKKIDFKPPVPDKYTLTIKQGDKEISDSPIDLNLSLPKAKNVALLQPPSGKIIAGQSINILFDTFPGGRGELTGSCKGITIDDVPVFISRQGITSKHMVTFLPTQEDEYNLEILYSGKPIKGSPFKIDLIPVNASLVKCVLQSIPMSEIGPIEMDICTEGAGNAKLKAKCVGDNCGQLPVDIVDVSKNNYHLKLNPTAPDIFTLSIKYGGKSAQDSPFMINTFPRDASKVEVEEPDSVEVGKAAYFKANTSFAGTGYLSAKVSGEKAGTLPVEVTEDTPAQYKVKLIPEIPDIYTVEIMWAGESVEKSPFIVDLDRIKRVKIGDLHVPSCPGTEENVWIEVDASMTGKTSGNIVTAECIGQNEEGSIPVTVEKDGSEKYKIEFNPKYADIYTLSLFFEDQLIPGGVLEINLLPKSNSKMVRHLDTFVPEDNDEPVIMRFDASQAGEGEMRARVNGTSQAGQVISRVELIDEAKKEYQLLFIPEGADTYNVDVYWCDESIPGSPIYVKVVYPNDVLVMEPVDPQVLHPIKVGVNTQYAGPGDLTALCSGEKMGEIATEITQDASDTMKYDIFFHPVEPDLYSLKIFFSDVEIKKSPVEVDLRSPDPVSETFDSILLDSPEIDIDLPGGDENEEDDEEEKPSVTAPTELNMIIGQPLILVVDSVDGDASLTALASGEKTGEVKISINTNDQEGSFNVNFSPTIPDLYTVNVEMRGVHVPGSPFIIKYAQAKVPDKTPTHPITKPYLIQFIPDYSIKDTLAYAIHDDSCIRQILKIKRGIEDKMFLVFKAQKTGLHFIHIKQGNKELRGSPFRLKILPCDPDACKAIVIPEKAYVGEQAILKIDTSKAGTSDMHVVATVPVGGKGTQYSYSDNGVGIFTIMFTPKIAGRHKLGVKWGGIPIPGSPFPMNVYKVTDQVKEARDAASRVYVMSLSLGVFKMKLNHTEGTFFDIGTEKAGRGILSIKANGPGNANINVLNSNTTYRCKVYPTISGKYDITILWNGVPIPGHPYQLDFTGETTYIINDLNLENESFILDQPSEFKVNCGRKEGVLDVLTTPFDCATVNITPLEVNGNVYSIKIVPKLVGNHEIALMFAGKHVMQSPYRVQFESPNKPDRIIQDNTIGGIDNQPNLDHYGTDSTGESNSEAAKVTAFGPGLQGGVIGQEGNFIVKMAGVGEGKLEVGVHGPKGTFQVQLRRHPVEEHIILVRYDPTHIGEYTIDILWCKEPIEGSPYTVDIKAQ